MAYVKSSCTIVFMGQRITFYMLLYVDLRFAWWRVV
jgi:hypothetical protein